MKLRYNLKIGFNEIIEIKLIIIMLYMVLQTVLSGLYFTVTDIIMQVFNG